MTSAVDQDPLLADILALWRTLLRQPDVTADTNFFTAGGKSLHAVQLLQRVGTELGLRVPLDAFVSAPTPRRFADRLRELGAAVPPEPSDVDGDVSWAVREAVGPACHLGVQLYVSVAGRPVYDLATGVRDGGEPVTTSDLMPWFSGGKPLLAAAICMLAGKGLLDLDEPVRTYLPEFVAGRTHDITCRHLLSHSAGRVRMADHGETGREAAYEAAVLAALAAQPHPDDRPGSQPSYVSSDASWLVLSELVRRVDGRRFDAYVTEEIAGPLGMEIHYGFPADRLAALGTRVTTYRQTRLTRHTPPGQSLDEAQRFLSSGQFHGELNPGDGMWASARDLTKFYEFLCARALGRDWGPSGPASLDENLARQMVTPQRPSFFAETPLIDYGLGLTLEIRRHGEQYAYFGSHCGLNTFGHMGHGWSPMAYADPDHELVVAFNGNGLPGRIVGKLIWHRISDAVYRELGLAGR